MATWQSLPHPFAPLPGYAFLMTVYFSTGVLQLVFLLLCLGILPAGRASDRPK